MQTLQVKESLSIDLVTWLKHLIYRKKKKRFRDLADLKGPISRSIEVLGEDGCDGQRDKLSGIFCFYIWLQGHWSEAFNFILGFLLYLLDRTILTF